MKIKRILAAFMAFSVIISATVFSSGAIQEKDAWIEENWSEISSCKGYIKLTPGTDRTQINFSWQSSMLKRSASIKIGKAENLSDAKELRTAHRLNLFAGEYTHEATVTELEADTTYYYAYLSDGSWSDTYSFTTGSEDKTKVLFVSDSQIGRSGNSKDTTVLQNDTYGWTKTVECAVSSNEDFSFVLSAGDQVQDSFSEKQYTLFESVPQLRSLPIAAVVGNHEFYTNNYSYHFNNPNDKTNLLTKNIAGDGYYFLYNNVLFVVLDSNNIDLFSHDRILSAAVKDYPDAKWRVVSMHHSPYDANSDKYAGSVATRFYVAKLFDKYDIDICLSGHDHYYSRSYMIKNNKVTDDIMKNGEYVNPEGILYISANSASGSNYYSVDYSAVSKFSDFSYQTEIPCYTVVEFEKNKLTVTTFETNENSVVDTVSIVKD